MEFWEIWRVVNIVIALVAVFGHLGKAALYELKYIGLDGIYGFWAVFGLCLGYSAGATYAWLAPGGDPGPWTSVMSVPLLWAAIAGCLPPRMAVRRSRWSKPGAGSPSARDTA